MFETGLRIHRNVRELTQHVPLQSQASDGLQTSFTRIDSTVTDQGLDSLLVQKHPAGSSINKHHTLFHRTRASLQKGFHLLHKDGNHCAPATQKETIGKKVVGTYSIPLGFFCLEEGSAQQESGPLCGVQLLVPVLGSHGDGQKEGHMM